MPEGTVFKIEVEMVGGNDVEETKDSAVTGTVAVISVSAFACSGWDKRPRVKLSLGGAKS